MHQLVANQRTYFNTHATKNIKFRRQKLMMLKKALQSNEELLYEAIYSDFKKSRFETYMSELAMVYHDIDEACKNLQKWSRKRRVKTNLLNFPATSYIIPEPLGVCLIIGAWNYPYQLSLAPMVAAIAAGCTVVLKPSELPAKTSEAMSKIISKNFSSEYIAVVEGGVQETTDLLQQEFDKIFFTGSTIVGKIVYKAAAENLTPVTLELGGKSPAFVLKDCNLKMAVKRLIWAKYLNAGQTCIAPDYVIVDRYIEEKFMALCKDEIEKEQFSFDNGNYTQIINDRYLKRLQGMIDHSKLYYGGKVNREQRYIEPTILKNITFDDAVMKEEIFGPILPIIPYDNLEVAIDQVRKLSKPLSCYVFTRSRKVKKEILNAISFGGGMVNDAVTHISNSNLPFGGIGSSGIGSYHGKAGFKAFTHYKSIVEKSTLLELPLKYYPHSKVKLWWIKQIFRF